MEFPYREAGPSHADLISLCRKHAEGELMLDDHEPQSHVFSVGDIVRLKSGGPKMTVYEAGSILRAGSYIVDCEWFAGDDLRRDAFTEVEIEKV